MCYFFCFLFLGQAVGEKEEIWEVTLSKCYMEWGWDKYRIGGARSFRADE